MPNRWQCTWCHHRSRSEDRLLVTINNLGFKTHHQKFCGVKCLRDYVILWEELERQLKCVGCGERFMPHDGRQKYHDEACRKRTWSRSQSTKEWQEVNNA